MAPLQRWWDEFSLTVQCICAGAFLNYGLQVAWEAWAEWVDSHLVAWVEVWVVAAAVAQDGAGRAKILPILWRKCTYDLHYGCDTFQFF